jgi:hypothetical protein
MNPHALIAAKLVAGASKKRCDLFIFGCAVPHLRRSMQRLGQGEQRSPDREIKRLVPFQPGQDTPTYKGQLTLARVDCPHHSKVE